MKSFKFLVVSLLQAPTISWSFITPTPIRSTFLYRKPARVDLRMADELLDGDIGEPIISKKSKPENMLTSLPSSILDQTVLDSLPFFLAPVAALAAGREAMLRRDEIKKEVATTEEELVKIKKLLKQSDSLIFGAFGIAAISFVFLLTSLLGGSSFPKVVRSLPSSTLAKDTTTVVVSNPMLPIPAVSTQETPLQKLLLNEQSTSESSAKSKQQTKVESNTLDLPDGSQSKLEEKLSDAKDEVTAMAVRDNEQVADLSDGETTLSKTESEAAKEDNVSDQPIDNLMKKLESVFSKDKEADDAETTSSESTEMKDDMKIHPEASTEETIPEPPFENIMKKFENAFSMNKEPSDTETSTTENSKVDETEALRTDSLATTEGEKSETPVDKIAKTLFNVKDTTHDSDSSSLESSSKLTDEDLPGVQLAAPPEKGNLEASADSSDPSFTTTDTEAPADASTITSENTKAADKQAVPLEKTEDKTSESTLDNFMKRVGTAFSGDKGSSSNGDETEDSNAIESESTETVPGTPTEEKTSESTFDNIMKKIEHAFTGDNGPGDEAATTEDVRSETTEVAPIAPTEEKTSESTLDNIMKKIEHAFTGDDGSLSPGDEATTTDDVKSEPNEVATVAPPEEKMSESTLDNMMKRIEHALNMDGDTDSSSSKDVVEGTENDQVAELTENDKKGEGAPTEVAPAAATEEAPSESTMDNLMKKIEQALSVDTETSSSENAIAVEEEVTKIDQVAPNEEKSTESTLANLLTKLENSDSANKGSESGEPRIIANEGKAPPDPPLTDEMKSNDSVGAIVAPSAKNDNKLQPLLQSRRTKVNIETLPPPSIMLPDLSSMFSTMTQTIDPQLAQTIGVAAASLAVGAGLIAFSQPASKTDSQRNSQSESYLNSLSRDTGRQERKSSPGGSYLEGLSKPSTTDRLPTSNPPSAKPDDIPRTDSPTPLDTSKRVVKFSQFEEAKASPQPDSFLPSNTSPPGNQYGERPGSTSGPPSSSSYSPSTQWPQNENIRTDTAPGRSYIDTLAGLTRNAPQSYAPQGKSYSSGSAAASYLDQIAQPMRTPESDAARYSAQGGDATQDRSSPQSYSSYSELMEQLSRTGQATGPYLDNLSGDKWAP